MFEFTRDLASVNDTSIVVRLVLAVLLGGVIGFERGKAGRPAGLRTHILVCLGSTLAIMTNQFITQEFGSGDPTRIAAQVVSGIGFLGAGTIIVTGRHQVKGLTTAAGLWATACMGIAIGIGFYKAAVLTCFLIFFVTVVLHRLDNFVLSKSKILEIYIEFNKSTSFNIIKDDFTLLNIKIDHIEIIKSSYGSDSTVSAIMTIRLKEKRVKLDLIAELCTIQGIEIVEEI